MNVLTSHATSSFCRIPPTPYHATHVYSSRASNTGLSCNRCAEDSCCKEAYRFHLHHECLKEWGETAYGPMCYQIEGSLAAIYGCTVKSLKVYNTCQVKNYADYDMDYFDAEAKHKYRDEHFEEDKQKSFELGKNILN